MTRTVGINAPTHQPEPNELRGDNVLRGMNRDRFVDRPSYHDQWNFVPPFR